MIDIYYYIEIPIPKPADYAGNAGALHLTLHGKRAEIVRLEADRLKPGLCVTGTVGFS